MGGAGARVDAVRSESKHAQLLICLTDVELRSREVIGRCDYPTVHGVMHPAAYTFQVYEVKTGRWITMLSIKSDDKPELSCPGGFTYAAHSTVEFAQGIKDKTLQAQLRPLVTGPARR